MDPLDLQVAGYVEALRDARKPSMEVVLRVVRECFESESVDYELVIDGSDGGGSWMWRDRSVSDQMPRYYVLTTSNSPGCVGYPMMTVRQAYSLKMDAWVTFSSLLPGPDESGVARSLALLIGEHACAFAGARLGALSVNASAGNPNAAIIAANIVMQMRPMMMDDLITETDAAGEGPSADDTETKKEMN